MVQATSCRLGLLVSACVGVAALESRAAIVMSENLDSYTDGAALAAPWVNISAGANGSLTTNAASQSTLTAGSLGLTVDDNTPEIAGSAPSARYNFASQPAGVGAPNNLVFSFDLKMQDNTLFTNYSVRLHGASASSNVGPAYLLDRNDDGDIYYRANNASLLLANDLSSDAWYRIVTSIDMVNKTYSVQMLGGTQFPTLTNIVSNVAFDSAAASVTELSGLSISDNNANGDGGVFLLDNFLVESFAVPEPASAALFAGLISGALRRRR